MNRTQKIIISAFGFFPKKRIGTDNLKDLAISIDRSEKTVKRNLAVLKKEKIIQKTKINFDFYILLTNKGKKLLEKLVNSYSNDYFIPKNHGIESSIRLMDVLELVRDPFLKIFLLDKFLKKDKFDLIDAINTFDLIDDQSTVFNLINQSNIFKSSDTNQNFALSLMDSSLITYTIEEIKKLGEWKDGSYEGLLVKGEMMIQRGQFEESLDLYNALLSLKNIPQNIWFIANVGIIKSLEGLNEYKKVEKMFDHIRDKLTNKIGLAYLKQLEADYLSTRGEHDKSKKLFESCIKTFQHYHYPQLLAVTYNNYGILNFNLEMYDEAEKVWTMAKRYAIEGANDYLIATINSNMASIMRLKQNFNKSEKLIIESEEIFKELKNLEKLSGSEFIRSLFLLSKGDVDGSCIIFNRSLNKTFPLLSEQKRKERIKVYSREVEKHKYTLVQNGQKIELVYKG